MKIEGSHLPNSNLLALKQEVSWPPVLPGDLTSQAEGEQRVRRRETGMLVLRRECKNWFSLFWLPHSINILIVFLKIFKWQAFEDTDTHNSYTHIRFHLF